MPVLTDLASAEVKRRVKKLYGMTLTRPTILISDGLNENYACDVHIGPTDPTGQIKQYLNDKKKDDEDPSDDIVTGIPGQPPEYWQLDDSLPGHVDLTLHNVAISRNNRDLIYADVGSPVICERTENGNWEITGFAMERPGTHMLYPVNLGDMTIGETMDLSIETRLLTLAEMGEEHPETYPFGSLPFGASAIFEGGEVVQIV
jgi:hypothetical protein